MPDPHSIERDRLLNELSSSLSPDGRGGGSLGPPPAPPLIPDHELLRCIGRGSYGEVWLAHSVMGPWRAVKIVHRRSFDHDRPFERELAGIRRFEPVSRSHPSQLNVLHVGRNDAAGCFYYVMELADDASGPAARSVAAAEVAGGGSSTADPGVPGAMDVAGYVPRTLRHDLLRRGRLPVEECLQVALALATALDHLHRHGLVHRDIKPSNIVFVGGIPKLADIGLVAAAEATLSLVGTEGYLPPEGPGTPQADIYSLGKVLYEMATGRDRQDYPELPTNLIEQPAAERAGLAELNEVIVRACHADLKQRYATAAELHSDLALLQSGKSVSRMRAVERRLRFVQRAGAVVTAIALIAAGLYLWQSRQTEAMRELAESRTRLAQDNNRLAMEARSRLIQIQTASGIQAMNGGDSATAALWFAEALKLSEGDAAAERRQRYRLGTLFRYLPQPVARLEFGPTESPAVSNVLAGLTPDGRQIVGYGWSAHKTVELRVWDAATFGLLRSLVLSNATFLQTTPDGRWGVVRDGERDVTEFWDLAAGRPVDSRLERSGGGWFAFSPDGTKLATTVNETELRILGVPSGRALIPPLMQSNRLDGLDWDPQGRWLATYTPAPGLEPGSRAWLARVWDTSNGEPVTGWIETPAPVRTAVFAPNGRAVAIGAGDPPALGESPGLVQVLDLPSGRRRFALHSNLDRVICLAFSPDGRSLAVGQGNQEVQLIDARTGETIRGPLKHRNRLYELVFSPDGLWLAAAGHAELVVWEVASGRTVGPALRVEGGWSEHTFTRDGRRLLATDASGRIEVWDWSRVEPDLPPLEGGDFEEIGPTGVTFSPNGKRVAVAAGAGNLRVWDLRARTPLGPPLEPRRPDQRRIIKSDNIACWSPDGTALVVPTGDSAATVWDVASGTLRVPALRHAAAVACALFSPDGTRIVTSDFAGTVQTWDSATGQPVNPPMRHSNLVSVVCFSRDGRRLATGSSDGTARVWDAATAAPVSPKIDQGIDVYTVDLSPDGTRVAVGGRQHVVTVHDAVTGEQQGPPLRHGATVSEVHFSPDGTRLATSSMDSTARVWDAQTGRPVTAPLVHGSYVSVCRFSPDGERLVTASHDGTARIWDAATGEPLGPPFKHPGVVSGAEFSPDGRMVASLSVDGASLWDVVPFDGSPDDAGVLARLWANGTVGPGGYVELMAPALRQEAWDLAVSRPESTARPADQSTVLWHRRRATLSLQRRDWTAAEFHLRALLAELPEDAEARAGMDRLQELSPPARDPATPAELIDLSDFYNASLAPVPWHPGPEGNHLGEVPRGIQTLAGTRFDVRGLVQVVGCAPYPPKWGPYPRQVSGIPIGRKVNRLQLLQSIQGGVAPEGTWVGRCVVHFADGRRGEIPIRYGRDAADWHEGPTQPAEVPDAVVAWRGMNPAAAQLGHRCIRLFKRTWTNPTPDVEVLSIDLLAEHELAQPFLVALTAE